MLIIPGKPARKKTPPITDSDEFEPEKHLLAYFGSITNSSNLIQFDMDVSCTNILGNPPYTLNLGFFLSLTLLLRHFTKASSAQNALEFPGGSYRILWWSWGWFLLFKQKWPQPRFKTSGLVEELAENQSDQTARLVTPESSFVGENPPKKQPQFRFRNCSHLSRWMLWGGQ